MNSLTVVTIILTFTVCGILTIVKADDQSMLKTLISADRARWDTSDELAVRRKRYAEDKKNMYDVLRKTAILKRKRRFSDWATGDFNNRATTFAVTQSTTPSSPPPPTTPPTTPTTTTPAPVVDQNKPPSVPDIKFPGFPGFKFPVPTFPVFKIPLPNLPSFPSLPKAPSLPWNKRFSF